MPITGGIHRGKDEIRSFFEQQRGGGGELQIASTMTDNLGDHAFDVGTASGTVRTEEGEQTIQAEYITLAKKVDGDWKVHRLASFMRQNP